VQSAVASVGDESVRFFHRAAGYLRDDNPDPT
jgi:hypothetical protein